MASFDDALPAAARTLDLRAAGTCRDQFRPPKAQISSKIGIGTPNIQSNA